jgi:Protein of unknown function (DUF3017)
VTVSQTSGSRTQLPFAVVMLIVVIGIVRIVMYHWREGTTEIGVALLVAAVLRMILPDSKVGLLAVRTRKVDILLYSGFAAMIIFISLTITGGPLNS